MRRGVVIALVSVVGFGTVAGIGMAGLGTWAWQRAALDTAGQVEFTEPLAIPPLAPATRDPQGRRVFDLTAGEGRHDLGTGPVRTWGFNGAYLGPTLRAQRGEEVVVNVHNRLPEATTVHWHGMHLPAAMDGGPHRPVAPGESWSPRWRVDQPAATLWYHPHPHGRTEGQVYRGLAGMFIVDDDRVRDLGLPDEYGVDDIPVIVQDKRFQGGELSDRPSFGGDIGVLGDHVVVNGTPSPYLDVTTERVRLRVLNASTARTYQFGFADDREFALIATDGGLLAAPHRTDRVRLSPGERAELVVRLRPGEQTVLRSYPPRLGVNAFTSRFSGGDDTLDVLALRAAGQLAPSDPVPSRLAELPTVAADDAVGQRDFALSGRRINGKKLDMDRIDATVGAGTVELWRVRNVGGAPHNFHIHGVSFQLRSRNGAAPPPELSGWKDTIYLRPMVQYELTVRFPTRPDPETPFMYHCHLLYHEDQAMMGQFSVVAPGPGPIPDPHDHDE